MKTTKFFSPVFLRFVEKNGKTIDTDEIFNPHEIRKLVEKWGERFSVYLHEMFSEIHRARFDFDTYGEDITQCDRWFLCAAVEHDESFNDRLLSGALRKLYTDDIAVEFSKEEIDSAEQKQHVLLWNSDKSFILTREKLLEKFDFRYKLTCRDCKYMQKIGNTDETGSALCTFQPSFEPITLDTRCRFLPETSELRCCDCDRFGNDFGCFTCSAEDSATPDGHLCAGYIDKRKVEVLNALYFWKLHNVYSREKVLEILDEFEREYRTPLD